MSLRIPPAAFLLAGLLVLAGCAGTSGKKEEQTQPYKPQYQQFELHLYPLGADKRWELYPGALVEAWAFAPEPDPSLATIPGPEIRVREGDTVEVTFSIHAPMAHTLHWHGIHVPWDQDGVPYLSQAPLGDPNFGGNGTSTFTYKFTVNQSGTYWYHCHVDTQHHLDMGMYGALIVEPADPSVDPAFDQEATLMFDEWDKSHIHSSPQSDSIISQSGDPQLTAEALYGQLRDYYHMSTLSTAEAVYDRARNDSNIPPPIRELLERYAPGDLARQNRTWYPVTYPAYFAEYDTFLINGKAFPLTEPIVVKNGQTLRMRLINAGSQPHSIHLHGHHFQVTHKDGYLLASPYMADTVFIAPGERYDIYVKLDNPGPWMLHDHMPQNEQNDNINPGGMMTHICYQDGWAFGSMCAPGAHPHMNSGDISEHMTKYFAAFQGAPTDPAYAGHQH